VCISANNIARIPIKNCVNELSNGCVNQPTLVQSKFIKTTICLDLSHLVCLMLESILIFASKSESLHKWSTSWTLCLIRKEIFPSVKRASLLAQKRKLQQGILKGEVSLYCWPPVWLVWNQLYEYWQFSFLFAKQTNLNQSNRRSTVQWYFPL